jgi:hypothetical protein
MAYTTIDKPDEYFDTLTWTGDNATRNITDLNFQPDWVWIKHRSFAFDHREFDSVRGASKSLATNKTSAEASPTDELTAFLSNGFTLGNSVTVNGTGYGSGNFVGWSWKANGAGVSNTAGDIASTVSANTTSGFSIVSFDLTGQTGVKTVGHGLGTAPKVVITKRRSGGAGDWTSYFGAIGNSYLVLNSTGAGATSADFMNNTAPTSSVFTVGDPTWWSQSPFIAYCFAEVKGYSKFSSYIGNGSATDGTFVYTGFKPRFIMLKGTTLASSWVMFDTVRSTINPVPITGGFLLANVSNAEAGTGDSSAYIDILSNGFKIRNDSGFDNNSGDTYIYMAFAENPFVTSTSVPTTAR